MVAEELFMSLSSPSGSGLVPYTVPGSGRSGQEWSTWSLLASGEIRSSHGKQKGEESKSQRSNSTVHFNVLSA